MAETPVPVRPVEPVTRPFDAEVALPGSKSYSNRALLVAALARGRSEITQALWSDDTRYMQRALEALGVRVRGDEAARAFEVEGVDGRFPATEATLDIGNAGTAARFLTAAVALGQGTFVVDGSPAMRKRPIQPLLDGLRALVRGEPRGHWPPGGAGQGITAPHATRGHLEPALQRRSPRPTPATTWRSRWRASWSRRPTSR
jgi:hypothetical protein